jgi:hypothetical protein
MEDFDILLHQHLMYDVLAEIIAKNARGKVYLVGEFVTQGLCGKIPNNVRVLCDALEKDLFVPHGCTHIKQGKSHLFSFHGGIIDLRMIREVEWIEKSKALPTLDAYFKGSQERVAYDWHERKLIGDLSPETASHHTDYRQKGMSE